MKDSNFFMDNITWFIAGIVAIMIVISIVLIIKIVRLKKEDNPDNKSNNQDKEQDQFSQLLANNIWEGSETAHQVTDKNEEKIKSTKKVKKDKNDKKGLKLGDKGFRPKMIFTNDNNNDEQESQPTDNTKIVEQPTAHEFQPQNVENKDNNILKFKLSKTPNDKYRFKLEENNITQLLSIPYNSIDEAKSQMNRVIAHIKSNKFEVDNINNGYRYAVKINDKIVAVSNTYPNIETAQQESKRIYQIIINKF